MSLLGVFVNTGTVVAGSLLGLLFRRGIPQRVSAAVMIGLGLCTVYIGVEGALEGQTRVLVLDRLCTGEGETVSVAEGFVTASLLFCVGAMTINGAIEAGVKGDDTIYFTKATLDLFSSMMLAAGLGIGVLLSAVFVLVFQGLLVLLAGVIAPALTPFAVAEMTCAGSLIMIAIGTNLMGISKIKVADYLPAILFAPIICSIVALF